MENAFLVLAGEVLSATRPQATAIGYNERSENRFTVRRTGTKKRGAAMPTVSIEEAQAQLPELIEHLAPGVEIVITRNAQPVAKLVGQTKGKPLPVFGRGMGKVIIVSEDEEHLKDFEDCMP
jgi:antitoxin (DNA-binding transcriptional repressor) of toxin-antitoxin stability system